MQKAGRSLILAGLLAVLVILFVGDVVPRFNLVDASAVAISTALGISYGRGADLFAAFSLILVGVCYWVAIRNKV